MTRHIMMKETVRAGVAAPALIHFANTRNIMILSRELSSPVTSWKRKIVVMIIFPISCRSMVVLSFREIFQERDTRCCIVFATMMRS